MQRDPRPLSTASRGTNSSCQFVEQILPVNQALASRTITIRNPQGGYQSKSRESDQKKF